ncbi:xanthine dehydrogenase family protein molybdopterin-binding subunit [Candidatus Uabimicrobium sp. HlEnr_7]|uniref:xanthine dehydrogenase family protein molybdopterin-binding subunit n=1 Tax=Candidatus Uabimicrobium helgolandensis TaxID=3095367 RepID=UPI0035587752
MNDKKEDKKEDNAEMKYVGKKTARVDGLALVSGQPVFADDIKLRNMLHAKILHSPHAHAHIKSIDTSVAKKVPGVKLVLTHEDFDLHYYTTAGQGYPEPSSRDTRILDSTVRFVGDRVAVVAADTIAAAEEAIEKIKVEYEVLEAIFDPRESMTSKILVHEQSDLTMVHDHKRNLIAELKAELGDVETAMKGCDHVFEEEYSVPYAQQSHIEPHIVVTWFDEHNRLIIRTATQVPFHVRRIVAEVLNFPVGRIRVIKPRIGGGFGSKQEILNEELCAAITLKTGQPARIEYTREEELYAARSRHPQILKVRMGVKDDGFIEAIDLNILENGGAYGTHSLTVMSVTANKALSFYAAPHKKLLGQAVYTNMSVPGAYRGYGAPQGFFAMEVMLDEIAAKLKIDPTELRHKNYVKEGDDVPIAKILGEGGEGYPMVIYTSGMADCIEEGKKLIDWDKLYSEEKTGRVRRGVGMIGCGQGSGIPGIDMAAAFIKMNEDASFNLLAGATDIGTGSDTMIAQIAAEVLEVPVEKIIVYSSDTDMTPFDTGAYASSTTYISGGAVKKAAEKVKQQILDMGKKLLKVEEAKIENGNVIANDGQSVSYEEICTKAFYTHEQHQIMANASHMSYDSPPPFNTTFADIEVDTETGIVRVHKIVSVSDAGQIINPQMAEGQVEGAIPQSLGYALSEFMVFDDKGAPINTNFFDYHIHTTIDMPEIVVKFVHTDEPTGPFGAKAIAEIPINGPAPAIANAIYNACGVRIRELPITPEKILQGLGKI